MNGFGSGFIFGLALATVVASAATLWAYRRFVLLERRARQAERLAELGTLTGGLAHEIKNPLSTVQLNLQLLREDLAPDGPQASRLVNRLDTVVRETNRLREILDAFLKYAGRLELDPKPTELNELIEELADFFAPQAQLQRVQLRLRKHPTPVTANIDARLIKQTLLNLMINALHAMPGGGELILAITTRDGDAFLDVIDTGTGIPPDKLPRIFDAFFTMKKGGTGLGLAMAKRIVAEHDGDISVQSEVGKGTDFKIRLPMAR
jgi:signal transduction histidine kinase